MKLRNKKTGEIVDFASVYREYDGANDIGLVEIGHERGATIPIYSYRSLAELNEEWEDYKEPKEYWYIYADKPQRADCGDILEEDFKAIGNYFSTKEEAQKAVEKLKAWKRLKDKGIRFEGYDRNYGHWHINFTFDNYCTGEPHSASDDLDLLFGDKK